MTLRGALDCGCLVSMSPAYRAAVAPPRRATPMLWAACGQLLSVERRSRATKNPSIPDSSSIPAACDRAACVNHPPLSARPHPRRAPRQLSAPAEIDCSPPGRHRFAPVPPPVPRSRCCRPAIHPPSRAWPRWRAAPLQTGNAIYVAGPLEAENVGMPADRAGRRARRIENNHVKGRSGAHDATSAATTLASRPRPLQIRPLAFQPLSARRRLRSRWHRLPRARRLAARCGAEIGDRLSRHRTHHPRNESGARRPAPTSRLPHSPAGPRPGGLALQAGSSVAAPCHPADRPTACRRARHSDGDIERGLLEACRRYTPCHVLARRRHPALPQPVGNIERRGIRCPAAPRRRLGDTAQDGVGQTGESRTPRRGALPRPPDRPLHAAGCRDR